MDNGDIHVLRAMPVSMQAPIFILQLFFYCTKIADGFFGFLGGSLLPACLSCLHVDSPLINTVLPNHYLI
jgi:hypothetical protein